MENVKFPFAPGLTLEQARDITRRLREQWGKEIDEAEKLNNSLGHRRTFPGYTGR